LAIEPSKITSFSNLIFGEIPLVKKPLTGITLIQWLVSPNGYFDQMGGVVT
jgi:hypothetical protein